MRSAPKFKANICASVSCLGNGGVSAVRVRTPPVGVRCSCEGRCINDAHFFCHKKKKETAVGAVIRESWGPQSGGCLAT